AGRSRAFPGTGRGGTSRSARLRGPAGAPVAEKLATTESTSARHRRDRRPPSFEKLGVRAAQARDVLLHAIDRGYALAKLIPKTGRRDGRANDVGEASGIANTEVEAVHPLRHLLGHTTNPAADHGTAVEE